MIFISFNDDTTNMVYNNINNYCISKYILGRIILMRVHSYVTFGGKDLIKEYLDDLPKSEKAEGRDTYGI